MYYYQFIKTLVPNTKKSKSKRPDTGIKRRNQIWQIKKTMTSEEKTLLQAKHRQEEAEARNRRKERNARTRRLIQEGAILENVAPHIKEMDLDVLKRELIIRLRGL